MRAVGFLFWIPFLLSSHVFIPEERCVSLELGASRLDPVETPLICAFSFQGASLIQEHPQFIQELEEEFLHQPIDLAAGCEIKRKISRFYAKHGIPFVVVTISDKVQKEGVLKIWIEEPRLGLLMTKGNKYVKPSELTQFVDLRSGEVVREKDLVRSLVRLNQNPFRRTDAVIRPGEKPGLVDIELDSIDRWPYRIFTGADNTGTAKTDRDRLFFGFNFNKLMDAEISYQFTCSPNWNLFYAHTGFFKIPCPHQQTLILFGGFSETEPKVSASERQEKMICWQVDGRYRIPFFTNSVFLQDIVVGYDFKQVSRLTHSKEGVDVNQFMIGYNLGSKTSEYRASLEAELYGNPGWITTQNKSSDYQKFRDGSSPYYLYLKWSQTLARQIGKGFWFLWNCNGQASTKALLPSEQFTLTGYNAVRGFEERVVNVDNALLFKLSLETPTWSIARSLHLVSGTYDELCLYAFFDCGLGGNYKANEETPSFVSLGSIGPGIRYQIDRWLAFRFDYGVQLWHDGFQNPSHSRYNFGLSVSY